MTYDDLALQRWSKASRLKRIPDEREPCNNDADDHEEQGRGQDKRPDVKHSAPGYFRIGKAFNGMRK